MAPKAELWATVKEFCGVTEDPHKFAEELDIIIQAYRSGLSDLYQLVLYTLAEGQAQHWVKTARRKHLEWDLEK